MARSAARPRPEPGSEPPAGYPPVPRGITVIRHYGADPERAAEALVLLALDLLPRSPSPLQETTD